MSADWPTEQAGTVAADAAARRAYENETALRVRNARSFGQALELPLWDNLHPLVKNAYREEVLSIVWAALKAIPDPRHQAYEEGYMDGYHVHPGDQSHPNGNPYPSGLS